VGEIRSALYYLLSTQSCDFQRSTVYPARAGMLRFVMLQGAHRSPYEDP
jgi:hypothetical protein